VMMCCARATERPSAPDWELPLRPRSCSTHPPGGMTDPARSITSIRGHARTLRPGADVVAEGVIDVTGYPDISELFLVADALITDYSSVMFDFTVTGKPIYFFTPDLVHYRDELRGFYFDLLAEAPGPVLTDPSELARSIKSSVPYQFAERYASWRARFNPRDDGHAGERVVKRMIAEGLFD